MDSFHVYICLSSKLHQFLLLHAPAESPKTVCSHPHRWSASSEFRSKNASPSTLVGRSWEKQAKNIVVFSEFISSFNQQMVDWQFGLVVWSPRILLWKGLLLRGYLHNPKPPIYHHFLQIDIWSGWKQPSGGWALGSFRWLVVDFWHWQIWCMHSYFFGGWDSVLLLAKWYRCSYQDGIRLNEIICFYLFGFSSGSFLAV